MGLAERVVVCRQGDIRYRYIRLGIAGFCSRLLTYNCCKIIVEHYIVIVLLNMTGEVEVFSEEAHQLVTRSVVCNKGRL